MVFLRAVSAACLGALFSAYGAQKSFCEETSKKTAYADFIGDLSQDVSEDLSWEKTWGVPWISDWDNPGKRGIQSRPSKIRRQVILIRHGQYQNEKANVEDSQRTLTPLGEAQATATGKYLAELFNNGANCAAIEGSVTQPKFLYVSNMTRAKQTMELICKGLRKDNVIVDPILRERFPCDPQPSHGNKRCHPSDAQAVEEAFSKYIHRPTTDESTCDIVVCHANVIRYFICRALQVPPEAWLRFSLPHCSLTSITTTGRGHVKVSYIGSAFHLPPDMQTTRNL